MFFNKSLENKFNLGVEKRIRKKTYALAYPSICQSFESKFYHIVLTNNLFEIQYMAKCANEYKSVGTKP